MDDLDIALRNTTYGLFVELGRSPTADEMAGRAGMASADVALGWQRLHDAHALVLYPGTNELRMANPFAARPTPYRVHADGRSWYANCAWDALGICAALHTDGQIETACADCGDEITVRVEARQSIAENDVFFHCLVPASQWWDDIVFS